MDMPLEPIVIPTPENFASPNHNTYTFTSSALDERPDFAALVAMTIAKIAEVDQIYQLVIISLLKAEARSIASLLRAIKNSDAIEKTIERVITNHANNHLKETYKAIKPKIKQIREIRNNFAHGIWGKSVNHPNAIILTKAENISESYGISKHIFYLAENGGDPFEQINDLMQSPKFNGAEVWTLEALHTAWRASGGAVNALQAFLICADRRSDEVPKLHEALRSYGLLSLPPHQLLATEPNG
ncbi:hypothetical protein OCK02_11635 [Rhizobium sp. TRM96647]|uniref:hypothetical protein n=1 Tax=unclassified Rhizobium TaxID=2613769 RepID=UPI0021E7A128|nr:MULTISPECIES: hypothetical protein [unclassified Rhizobium]MCV3736860.1 hypothetical protein [Rhizobium sp. TRM96647]MCV3756740.1 hypothetical protein [Rhizobium sp. TRM96650]